MTTEKPIQDLYTQILDAANIEYIHIGNRMFKNKYRTPLNLKYFADLLFLYEGVLYLRECGIKNRHKDQKEKQMEKMLRWSQQGANIRIILTEEAALKDLECIFEKEKIRGVK
jgi:hypothetical protein